MGAKTTRRHFLANTAVACAPLRPWLIWLGDELGWQWRFDPKPGDIVRLSGRDLAEVVLDHGYHAALATCLSERQPLGEWAWGLRKHVRSAGSVWLLPGSRRRSVKLHTDSKLGAWFVGMHLGLRRWSWTYTPHLAGMQDVPYAVQIRIRP